MTKIAWWLRCLADRIDPKHAPRAMGWSFTFTYDGVKFHRDNRGCPLWYLGWEDYDRAHREVL